MKSGVSFGYTDKGRLKFHYFDIYQFRELINSRHELIVLEDEGLIKVNWNNNQSELEKFV